MGINSANNSVDPPTSPLDKVTVREAIYDKFIIRLDNGSFISEYTKEIAKLINNISIEDLERQFTNTHQFELSQEMLRLATTPKSLGFLPHDSKNYTTDSVILETALPLALVGSCISHTDIATYNNTSDYLMLAGATHGRTLKDFVEIGGNYSGGVIGPKTRLVLETIG